MPLHPSTVAQDRLLVEEVLRLRALWNQGPPRRPSSALRPANPPAFKKRSTTKGAKNTKNKKQEEKSKKKKSKKQRDQPQPSNPPTAAAEKEWPCPPTPPPTTTGFTAWNASPPPTAALHSPSVEDQARAAALQAQHSAIKYCEEFFSGSDNDIEDEAEEDSAMDEDVDGDGSKLDAFKFFLGLFEKDGELRGYYEKNCDNGQFSCLVCEGIGAKKGRRFPNCVGLVQHAKAISKTKRKEAHRKFAMAVCRVLGWNIERLPSIVLDLGDPLGISLAKAANAQEDVKEEGPKEVANKVENCGEDLMESAQNSEIEPLLTEFEEKEEHPKEVADVAEDRSEKLIESVEQSEADPLLMEVEEEHPKEVADVVDDRGENLTESVEQSEADQLLMNQDVIEDAENLPKESVKLVLANMDITEIKEVAGGSPNNQDVIEDAENLPKESVKLVLANMDITEIKEVAAPNNQGVVEDAENFPKESVKLVLANMDSTEIKDVAAGSPNKNGLTGEKVDLIMEVGDNVEPGIGNPME